MESESDSDSWDPPIRDQTLCSKIHLQHNNTIINEKINEKYSMPNYHQTDPE